MFDAELVQDISANILTAIARIERGWYIDLLCASPNRSTIFEGITTPDDFILDDHGIDRLDGITMMLIAIGEQLKQLDAILDYDLNDRHPNIDWKGAKGVRDFLSHHYFNVDAEVIFDICQNKIGELKQAILDVQMNV